MPEWSLSSQEEAQLLWPQSSVPTPPKPSTDLQLILRWDHLGLRDPTPRGQQPTTVRETRSSGQTQPQGPAFEICHLQLLQHLVAKRKERTRGHKGRPAPGYDLAPDSKDTGPCPRPTRHRTWATGICQGSRASRQAESTSTLLCEVSSHISSGNPAPTGHNFKTPTCHPVYFKLRLIVTAQEPHHWDMSTWVKARLGQARGFLSPPSPTPRSVPLLCISTLPITSHSSI